VVDDSESCAEDGAEHRQLLGDVGGLMPSRTSRSTPPPTPVKAATAQTPKRSSLLDTPTSAPEAAKATRPTHCRISRTTAYVKCFGTAALAVLAAAARFAAVVLPRLLVRRSVIGAECWWNRGRSAWA
jgi:hypothetical protein